MGGINETDGASKKGKASGKGKAVSQTKSPRADTLLEADTLTRQQQADTGKKTVDARAMCHEKGAKGRKGGTGKKAGSGALVCHDEKSPLDEQSGCVAGMVEPIQGATGGAVTGLPGGATEKSYRCRVLCYSGAKLWKPGEIRHTCCELDSEYWEYMDEGAASKR